MSTSQSTATINDGLYTCGSSSFHSGLCNEAAFIAFNKAFRVSIRKNGLIYILLAFSKGPSIENVLKTIRAILRTSLLYAMGVTTFSRLRCAIVKWVGNKLAVFIPALISYGLCSLIEDRAQLCNTLIFQGSDTLYTLGNIAVHKKLIPNWSYSSVFVFATTFSVLNYLEKKNKQLPMLPQVAMKFLLPTRNNVDVVEKFMGKFFGAYGGDDDNEEWKLPEIVTGVIKNFGLGFILHLGYSVLNCFQNSNTLLCLENLKNCLGFGSFFGSLLLINRGFPTLLKKLTHRDVSSSIIVLLLNGFLSGFSMIFYPSASIASFFLSNTLFACASNFLIRYPKLQCYYYPFLIYGFSTGISVFALYFENKSVPKSWREGLLPILGGTELPYFYKEYYEKTLV